MAEGDTAATERAASWRAHLEHALGQQGQTLILADMDAKGSAALQLRCQRPRDLLDLARVLIEQAQDALENSPGEEAENLLEIAEAALAILPDARE